MSEQRQGVSERPEGRRAFLKKAAKGTAALAATTVVVSAASKPAMAAPAYGGGGGGGGGGANAYPSRRERFRAFKKEAKSRGYTHQNWWKKFKKREKKALRAES